MWRNATGQGWSPSAFTATALTPTIFCTICRAITLGRLDGILLNLSTVVLRSVTTVHRTVQSTGANVALTYAAEVEKCITPKTLAVCADNTSTNTGQIKGMFGILRRKFSLLFFIGCCVHTMEFVCEGWAKIKQLATIIKKVKDAMQFVRRHSILHEEFRELQKQRHLTDRSASMSSKRTVPQYSLLR